MNLFDLRGKTVLVTAATAGLGLAMARALAGHGASVVVTGRTEDKLSACVAALNHELSLTGASCIQGIVYKPVEQAPGQTLQATDSVQTAAAALVDEVVRRCGALHAAFINAGTHGAAPLQDWSPAQWSRVMQTNVDAAFFLAQQAAKQMATQDNGRIVFTSSLTGLLGRPSIHAYTASKAALLGMTRSLAVELAPQGITCNALVPGYFETDLSAGVRENTSLKQRLDSRIPLGRWGQPEDLQGLAVYLASNASSYTTGHSFVVDGGMSIAV